MSEKCKDAAQVAASYQIVGGLDDWKTNTAVCDIMKPFKLTGAVLVSPWNSLAGYQARTRTAADRSMHMAPAPTLFHCRTVSASRER